MQILNKMHPNEKIEKNADNEVSDDENEDKIWMSQCLKITLKCLI